MNPVFATNAFWQSYLTLEPDEMSKDELAAQLDDLQGDYPVHKETVKFKHAGRSQTATRRFVEFPFSCGDRFSLVLEYEPQIDGCSKTLFLADACSGDKAQMGWWDLAQWHPYCLHPDEFDSLLQFWRRWDPRWQGEELPLLLLCQFIGLPDANARDSLAARAEAAFKTLGLPEASDGQQRVPLDVPEGDYYWEVDKELGLVFSSDEYCCYSIRNRAHADSDEGGFPFAAFGEMMTEVQRRLNRARRRGR